MNQEQSRECFQSPLSKSKYENIFSQKQGMNTKIGNFYYSPTKKLKQSNSQNSHKEFDSFSQQQKSPRSTNYGMTSPILKNQQNSAFEKKIIEQVDLYNDSSPSNQCESQDTQIPDIQHHSRSKTEQIAKSVSPPKQSDKLQEQDYQIKMEEIENEQKELEMKQNILKQYKELLQHKIELKDKNSISKINEPQIYIQQTYQKINENSKNYSISDLGCNSSQESEQFEISPQYKNKKQITWSLNETKKSQKIPSQKNVNNLTQDDKQIHMKIQTSDSSRPQSVKKNSYNNQKQKILFSDLIQKMKDKKEGNSNEKEYKPSIPYVLINKITEKDRNRQKNANFNSQDKQNKQSKVQKQEGRKNDQSPSNNFMIVRQQFMEKCVLNKQVKQTSDHQVQTDPQLPYEGTFKQNKPLNYQNLQVQIPNQWNHDSKLKQDNFKLNNTQNPQQLYNNFTEIKTSSTVSFNSIKDENIDIKKNNNQNHYQKQEIAENNQSSFNNNSTTINNLSSNQMSSQLIKSNLSQQQKQQLEQQKIILQQQSDQQQNQFLSNNYSNYTIYSNPNKTSRNEQDSEKEQMNNVSNNNYINSDKNITNNISKNNVQFNNIQQKYPAQESQNFQEPQKEQSTSDKKQKSYNYIKQMIDQKFSTQNQQYQSNNTTQINYRDFQEPEGDIYKNIEWQQKTNQNIQQNKIFNNRDNTKQIQHSSSCKNINNQQYNKIRDNNETFHMNNQQNIVQQNQQQNFNFKNNNQKIDSNLSKSQQLKVIVQPEMKINQGMLSARGIAGENPIVKQEKQINLQNKFKEVQFQIDKLIYDTLGESEYREYNQFETQRQTELQNANQLSNKVNKELKKQNEEIQLLQFQLDESMILNQENKVKKEQFQTKNNSNDINIRSQIWMYNKEKNVKKQLEDKQKREIQGCTFKPKIYTNKDLNGSLSPLKMSVNTPRELQKLNFQDIESPIYLNDKGLTRDDIQSFNEKISLMTKKPIENSPSLFKTQNNNKSAFANKNNQNLKENKQNLTYQMINFKKKGSLHKFD